MGTSIKGISTLSQIPGVEAMYAARQGMKQSASVGELTKSDGLSLAPNLRDNDPEQVRKAATDFEGLLVKQMLDSMWSTVHTKDQLLGSKDEETYRDLFNQALSASVAEGQGLGIKDIIVKELDRSNHGIKSSKE